MEKVAFERQEKLNRDTKVNVSRVNAGSYSFCNNFLSRVYFMDFIINDLQEISIYCMSQNKKKCK